MSVAPGMARFHDRSEAGRRLAARLMPLKDGQPVVLALPRGGVPVAVEIAQALAAPLDLLLVRKIGAPRHPELAIGAVVDGHQPQIVLNWEILRSLDIPHSYVAEECARQIQEIERRRQLYLRGRTAPDISGRMVIIVDDGIATGATMRVALQGVRDAGAGRVVLAAPVAPAETAAQLAQEADEVVILETPESFEALSSCYEDFPQIEDAEVVALLDRAAPP